jgi:ABC-type nickel/cobalt efflux system permease component RcnA
MSPALLVFAVAAVGVLHTLVPDHWVPIALVARQEGWSRSTTVRSAALAGTGHAISTLLIAVIVWLAGAAVAARFGNALNLISSIGLIVFGGWIALSSFREMRAKDQTPAQSAIREPVVAPRASRPTRLTLMLILGSSPMVEGIPVFFAAAKFGAGLLAMMSVVFAAATIATYVALVAASARGLEQLRFPALERYGEVISGALIAALGVAFALWSRG